MYLIIKTDSETSDLGRISTPFTSLPTLEDVVKWNGRGLKNDGNCGFCTWTIVDCNTGKEVGSYTVRDDGEARGLGCLR
jgi:hypothetical protein